VFTLASAPSGTIYNEATITPTTGLLSGAAVENAGGEHPVPGAASDHAAPQAPIVRQ
jgi:hypothetical protein